MSAVAIPGATIYTGLMHGGIGWMPFHLSIALILTGLVVALAGFAFWVWSVIDCAQNETDADNNRLIWLIVIGFGGVVGCAVYWLVRRRQRVGRL